ncbi:MAG: rhamnogalacturonan acetylesterase [Chthoniobacteraceae bacterium]
MNVSRRRLLVVAAVFAASFISNSAEPKDENEKPIVVLVGDSTVASKSGWGDAFGQMLESKATVFNEAQGGRSSKSFRDEGHWKRAIGHQPTWVLIQFGHNDQPGKGPARETDPKTTFRENLGRYVDETRAIGARPVLITSLTRRNFEDGQIVRDLAEYVEGTKIVAAEKQVPLVDLNARSIEQAEKLGPKGCEVMEPWGKPAWTKDHTHLNKEGAALVAPLVVDELRKVAHELAKLIGK